jgi:hypothetical protein
MARITGPSEVIDGDARATEIHPAVQGRSRAGRAVRGPIPGRGLPADRLAAEESVPRATAAAGRSDPASGDRPAVRAVADLRLPPDQGPVAAGGAGRAGAASPPARTSPGSLRHKPGICPRSLAASPARRSAGRSRRPGRASRHRSASRPPSSRPTGSPGRTPHGPSSRRGGPRPGRSSTAFCRRTPTSHRIGLRPSPGEKATSSSCRSWAWPPARRM